MLAHQQWTGPDAVHHHRHEDQGMGSMCRNAECQQRDKSCCRRCIVCGFRCGNALDRSGAKFLGCLGQALLDRVSAESRHHRTPAGKHTEQRPKGATTKDRRPRRFPVIEGRPESLQVGLEDFTDLGLLHIQQHFGDAVEAHGHGHEIETGQQIVAAERKPVHAEGNIAANHAEHASDSHGHKALEDRFG